MRGERGYKSTLGGEEEHTRGTQDSEFSSGEFKIVGREKKECLWWKGVGTEFRVTS